MTPTFISCTYVHCVDTSPLHLPRPANRQQTRSTSIWELTGNSLGNIATWVTCGSIFNVHLQAGEVGRRDISAARFSGGCLTVVGSRKTTDFFFFFETTLTSTPSLVVKGGLAMMYPPRYQPANGAVLGHPLTENGSAGYLPEVQPPPGQEEARNIVHFDLDPSNSKSSSPLSHEIIPLTPGSLVFVSGFDPPGNPAGGDHSDVPRLQVSQCNNLNFHVSSTEVSFRLQTSVSQILGKTNLIIVSVCSAGAKERQDLRLNRQEEERTREETA